MSVVTTDDLKVQLQSQLAPKPTATPMPVEFYFVMADDHVDRMTAKAYDFKRYGSEEEAARVAKGMSKRLGVPMFVLKAITSYVPEAK